MLIKEVSLKSDVTKKAIEYYELKKLIKPQVLENGYRYYSEEDVSKLKEISVLRKCGMSIPAIKEILYSANKAATLLKYKYITELKIKKLNTLQNCISNLIEDYNIEREYNYLKTQGEDIFTIKEKFVLAFPGTCGVLLSMHFGRFLNELIDTDEKRKAYEAILNYLDNIELHLQPEIIEYLEQFHTTSCEVDKKIHDNLDEVLIDTKAYLENNQEEINEYVELRNSDEFKNSPAWKFYTKFTEFQKKSGYKEILIHNMKILSKSYNEYFAKLEEADIKFTEKFPKVKELFHLD